MLHTHTGSEKNTLRYYGITFTSYIEWAIKYKKQSKLFCVTHRNWLPRALFWFLHINSNIANGVKRGGMIFWVEYPFLFFAYCVHNLKCNNQRGWRTHHTQYKDHIIHAKHKRQYLVVFGSLGQVKSGVDFCWTLLTEGWQLEGNWLGQAVTCLQLQVGWFSRDLVEVSEEICQKSAVIEGKLCPI